MAFKWETRKIHDKDGNVYELSFEEAQKQYGLKL